MNWQVQSRLWSLTQVFSLLSYTLLFRISLKASFQFIYNFIPRCDNDYLLSRFCFDSAFLTTNHSLKCEQQIRIIKSYRLISTYYLEECWIAILSIWKIIRHKKSWYFKYEIHHYILSLSFYNQYFQMILIIKNSLLYSWFKIISIHIWLFIFINHLYS
jgi:hypothetical protein